jgi:hypothetical protein
MYHEGSAYYLIRELQKLNNENRRDDALDLAHFFRENQTADQGKLTKIENELEYTPTEKIKSFVWNGVVKGEAFNAYSALGAISTDLCIIGDTRDLGIQCWKYLTGGQDFDGFALQQDKKRPSIIRL